MTGDYLRLEALIQKVVSPYLGTHGLFSRDGSSASHCSSCLLETRLQRSCSPAGKNLVVRSKSYNVPLLTPVVENDPGGGGGVGIRRHSVCEMTSCVEESAALVEATTGGGSSDQSSASTGSAPHSDSVSGSSPEPRLGGMGSPARPRPRPVQPQRHHSPSILPEPSPGEDPQGSLASHSSTSSRALAADTSSGPSPSSSLDLVVTDHILESLDSEPEHDGIFLDFSHRCSGGSAHSIDSGRQSVA